MDDIGRPKFSLHAEIPTFLTFFSIMLTGSVSSNFMIYRTCYVILGYNESDCAELGSKNASNATNELEQIVEPYANLISMTVIMPAQLFPAILCLFVGPWSDNNGRKPVLVSSAAGFTLAALSQVVIAAITWLSPWYTVIPSIAGVILGGFSPFLMLLLCYITDVSTPESRGLRIGIIEGVMALGSLLGTLSSSYVFEAIGYVGVFGIAALCNAVNLLYIYFFLPETIVRNSNASTNSIVSYKNVRDMFRTLFKRRLHHIRSIMLLTLVLMILYVFATNSDGTVTFYFLRAKFHWDLEKYTLFKSARDGVWIFGTFLGLYLLHKLLGLHELILMLISFILLFLSSMVQGFADLDWHIYLAAVLRCTSGVIGPMCRSFISKSVSNDEMGKIFAVAIMLETLAVAVGSPIYSMVYNETISTYPGAFNFVTAGVLVIQTILTMLCRASKFVYAVVSRSILVVFSELTEYWISHYSVTSEEASNMARETSANTNFDARHNPKTIILIAIVMKNKYLNTARPYELVINE